MVREHEAEFGKEIENQKTQDSPDISEGNKGKFMLYTIDGSGQKMGIKETPYFSDEAKELLAMRGGVTNKKKELTAEEQMMEDFMQSIDGANDGVNNLIKENKIDRLQKNDQEQTGVIQKNSKFALYAGVSDSEEGSSDEASCDFPDY